MNLQALSNTELCQRMEHLVRSERKITHLVLIHILEIEIRKIYADLGYDGMYAYLTKHLGYGESSAYRRLQSARLLQQIPSAAQKIESGSLNLSQTTKLQKCLKDQKQKGEVMSESKAHELITRLENKNTFETEKVLAIEFNMPIQMHESLKPQKDDSARLEVTFTNEQYQDLLKAKELLSHICPQGTWAEILATLAKKYIDSKRPEQGKQEASSTPATKPTTHSFVAKQDEGTQEPSSAYRPSISSKTRNELMRKADHRCEYQDAKTKNKCCSTYQLEVDHIQPLALGGSNDINNLRILCRTHNVLMANRSGLI